MSDSLPAGSTGDQSVQAATGYRVSPVSPEDVDYTSSDWSGSDAKSSLPNPDTDEDRSALDQSFLFVPEGDDARTSKSNWKGPFRSSPDGPVNTNALQAIVAAINGARGGFDGLDNSTLRSGYDRCVGMLMAAGEADTEDDVADFEASAESVDTDPFDGVDLEAAATGAVQVDVDFDQDDLAAAEAAEDGLAGIIWGAGDHDLSLGGDPTPVHVPEDTVQPTFDAMRQDIQDDDRQVGIGTDHPDPDSVAAQTGTVEIGHATDAALSADGTHIVLTDSTLTSDSAQAALEAGDFDGLDFSIVGDVAIRRDDDGNPATQDGRIILDATRIRRVDVVQDGAVDAAGIGQVPDLADHATTVRQAADENNPEAAASALRASATAIRDATPSNLPMSHELNTNPDDLDAAHDELEAAAGVIEDTTEELEAARQRADAFDDVLEAMGVDPDQFDHPAEAAQRIVDERTKDIREDIAELEANLANHDVGTDHGPSVDQRVEALAGKAPSALRNTLNARKADAFDVQQAEASRNVATSRAEASSGTGTVGASAGDDEEANDIALGAMDGADRVAAKQADKSAAEFVRDRYGLKAGNYSSADELHADIIDQMGVEE